MKYPHGCLEQTVSSVFPQLYLADLTELSAEDKTEGEVLFNGTDIFSLTKEQLRQLRPKIQIIFQDPFSSLSPRLPVGDIIGEAVKEHGRGTDRSSTP